MELKWNNMGGKLDLSHNYFGFCRFLNWVLSDQKKKKLPLSKILLCHLDFRVFLHSKQLNVWKCKKESIFLSSRNCLIFFFISVAHYCQCGKLSVSVKHLEEFYLPELKEDSAFYLIIIFFKLWVRSLIQTQTDFPQGLHSYRAQKSRLFSTSPVFQYLSPKQDATLQFS